MAFLSVLLAAGAFIACGGSNTPTAPTPAPVPDCQAHNTATLVMVNSATNLLPREVYLDGADIGLLPFGSQLQRTISAGVAHPVEFRSAVNGIVVSNAQPNLVQCSTFTLTNTF